VATLIEVDEPVRVGVGQRPQQDAVDNAEESRRRGDAQGHDHDRGQSKAGAVTDSAQGGSEIVAEGIHEVSRSNEKSEVEAPQSGGL
jgi:hypothetical protein